MKNHLLLSVFFFCSTSYITAQETGTLILHTIPPIGRTVAKVGDTILQNSNKILLAVGTYEVTFWAPYYQPLMRTVTISADSTSTLQDQLELSEEMKVYRQSHKAYNREVLVNMFLPYSCTALFAIGSTISWVRARNYQQQALKWKAEYETAGSPGGIADYKERYKEAQSISTNSKIALYTLSGLTAVGCFFSWKGYKNVKQLKKPVLTPQSPPFEVDSFGAWWGSGKQPVLSLTLNF